MPTYVYRCPVCERTIELIERITETSRISCALPSCSEKNVAMERIIQPSNFVLKGGGWAKDGYSSKK